MSKKIERKEASCRAFIGIVKAFEVYKKDPNLLVQGTDVDVDRLKNPSKYTSWDDFCTIMDNLEKEFDGKIPYYEISKLVLVPMMGHATRGILSYISSSYFLYQLVVKYAGPANFPLVSGELKKISETECEMILTQPEDYRQCDQFFHMSAASFQQMPTVLGAIEAKVDYRISGRKCIYRIHMPPSISIFARVRRALNIIFRARTTIEDLGEQQYLLNESQLELSETHRQIENQRERLDNTSKMVALGKLASIGQMAAGVAHEINNPLAVLQGNAELLKDRLKRANHLTPVINRSMTTIEGTVKRIADIVRGLQSLSRSQRDENFSYSPVAAIVENAVSICRESFRNRGIELVVSDVSEELEIECNGTQISEVLINLINNAGDAVLDLDQKWVQVEIDSGGENVRFSVTDSGNGLPDSLKKHLFDPFFTTKTLGKGTGLGLSISRSIIEKHQGEMWIDDESPHTRFVFRVPKHQKN